MEIVTIIVIAIALAMDSFAVSITLGLSLKKFRLTSVARICCFFACFQGIMPVIGWWLGHSFADIISAYDHWLAFGLLSFIGGKMIYEAMFAHNESEKAYINTDCIKTITTLAIATSIDALAVGISFSLLNVDIILPAIIIGIVTFLFSLAGIGIGWRIGSRFRNKVEILGGILLIGIGIKVLIDHML
ncbi:manganese efflux pump MntP family protein [Carboxylicivirga sp. N1Y90]|uniref:manganese efflux pump MntP n=1 Tax=Carboxylicivirga fragile TaxID=3417571 RepID=UPI003D32F5EE|nr:manganese efflux pump [Marinilabiliaceae bacterium N1Y90]